MSNDTTKLKRHTYDDIQQGTTEWDDMRRGMLTASVMNDFVTLVTKKTSKSAKARAITNELVAQRITGYTEPSYMNDDMLRGLEDEETARDLYSEHHAPVTETGFMTAETKYGKLGYSPDGLVGDEGLIEVKSRKQKLHLATILSDTIPADHVAQLQTAMVVSGREWVDYISFCAGMPMWIKRVTLDPAWKDTILETHRIFEEDAAAMEADYHRLTKGLIPTERPEEIDLTADITI